MQKRVIVKAKAEQEMQQAIDWYVQRSTHVGNRLESEIDDAIHAIAERNAVGPEVRPRIRRIILRTFPYGVFYAIEKDAVYVLAFRHHARNPGKWPKR